ncbi:hypothetical protein, partial [Klebsiella pneumoniae]|uniref:hypothetical protein n=1 Tax=Klebsiella pneumoniae TaxID=573 RepID=UPI003F93C4A5
IEQRLRLVAQLDFAQLAGQAGMGQRQAGADGVGAAAKRVENRQGLGHGAGRGYGPKAADDSAGAKVGRPAGLAAGVRGYCSCASSHCLKV